MTRLYMCLLCGILLLQAATVFADSKVAGWIESMSHSAKDYKLVRHNRDHSLTLLTPVYEGDVIEVIHQDASLGVKIANKSHEIQQADSPYIVQGQADSSSVGENLLAWAAEMLGDSEASFSRSVGAVSRGNKLRAPLMFNNNSKIAQRDELLLRWSGGQSPFSVEIIDTTGEKLVTAINIQTREKLLDVRYLSTGQYTVAIDDSASIPQSFHTNLTIVSHSQLPTIPSELEGYAPWLKEILYAIWLTEEGEMGEWLYEGAQRLYQQREHEVAAKLLGKMN